MAMADYVTRPWRRKGNHPPTTRVEWGAVRLRFLHWFHQSFKSGEYAMIEVVIKNKKSEAEGIVSFELERSDGRPLPPFSAGSHIDVHAPGGHVVQYSLCNPPWQHHSYQIAVLRDPASRGGSAALHERTSAGDKLMISEPRNMFPLARDAGRALLVAGGIGVTPILCMAERLSQSGAAFELHYCARSPERAAFVERIRNAPFAAHASFHFDDSEGKPTFDAAALLRAPPPDAHLYVCGPGGFMDAVLRAAADAGWPAERVHREYFAAPATGNAGVERAFQVKVASTGEVYTVAADKSITDVLAEHGVYIPVGCREGLCGTCATRLLDGQPDHRDVCLSDAERAANDQLMPCCSRAASAMLVLDI
jgi:vanillate O-demethylase ferredoxin subunit